MKAEHLFKEINSYEIRIQRMQIELFELREIVKHIEQLSLYKGVANVVLLSSEEHRIKYASMICKDNRKKTAELLEISERSLYRKIKEYSLPHKRENHE